MSNTDKLALQEIINYLGQPIKQDSKHAYWQCPECRDKGRNNLTFTLSIGVLKSWCCDSCRKICGEIIKNRYSNNNYNKPAYQESEEAQLPQKPVVSEETHILNTTYKDKCCQELCNSPQRLNYLKQSRGLNKDTLLLGIGIDTTKKCWVIPVYDSIQNDYKLIGFEYRGLDFADKKIWKEKSTYSCLSPINEKTCQTEIMIVLEGFWDAYCFYQYLTEKGQAQYYHIFTPSNGVGSVIGRMKTFNFTPYKKVILYLDSDEKGLKAMEEIKKCFPFVETIVMDCGCKDFNEHYIKCINQSQS